MPATTIRVDAGLGARSLTFVVLFLRFFVEPEVFFAFGMRCSRVS
jgi:hypothetical protein